LNHYRKRDVHGILLFDKPAGISSNDALQKVKRLFNAQKAGHTGSLDLLATGLLPLCFGEATKFSSFLLNATKRYQTIFKLGIVTETGDAEGAVLETKNFEPFTQAAIQKVLQGFVGLIEQVPPMHSALKHQGQRLYKLAHQGITVERQARPVTIHEIRLLRYEGDQLEVYVSCSKGTYIRTLAEDIGNKLGCGAHVEALRRVGVGPFDIQDALDLPALQHLAETGFAALDLRLLPVESALADEPGLFLSGNISYYLLKGQPVQIPHAPTHGLVRLYDDQRQFLGVGEVLDDGRIAPRRLVRA
jgi:tRNA pseudouridine55 synthase